MSNDNWDVADEVDVRQVEEEVGGLNNKRREAIILDAMMQSNDYDPSISREDGRRFLNGYIAKREAIAANLLERQARAVVDGPEYVELTGMRAQVMADAEAAKRVLSAYFGDAVGKRD